MKEKTENTDAVEKLLSSNPEAIEKLIKANRFPLEKKSTIIMKEDSLKDFTNIKSKLDPIVKRNSVASFSLKTTT